VLLHELSKRLVADGHEVTILTARYPGSKKYDTIDGARIVRIGSNPYNQSFLALMYYLRHYRNKFDVVIDVVNTAPHFASLFGGSAKQVLIYYQLAKEVWFHETKQPLSWFGYHVLEPVSTFMLSHFGAKCILTISESSKRDLISHGFKPNRISIMSVGIQIKPVKNLASIVKYSQPTLLSLGSIRPMKVTADQIKAFELAKHSIKNLQLKIAGSAGSAYGQKVLAMIANSPYAKDIEYLGKVSQAKKIQLMQKSHLILVTSIKEGWGLIVTEANSQGTPAIVYDVDGLRDSVRNNKTGLICKTNTPKTLADNITKVLKNKKLYAKLCKAGWEWSQEITFDQNYQDFMVYLE
jgi:glycosyltransferase involved in cell wall biosynthesis